MIGAHGYVLFCQAFLRKVLQKEARRSILVLFSRSCGSDFKDGSLRGQEK